MKSCLYMQSIQGTGKSMIIELLMDMLGRHCTYTTNDTAVVTGQFNSQLMGQALCVIEEPPVTSANSWHAFTNALKPWITNTTCNIHPKHGKPFDTKNCVSWILLTNHNSICVDPNDRRFVCLDVSTEFVGNDAYFNEMADICEDPEVQEALFSYCRENAPPPTWKEKIHPFSRTKQQKVVDNLAPVMQYIKEEMVLKHRGIDQKFVDFYENFVEWCRTAHKRAESKSVISKVLTENEVMIRNGGRNITYVWQSAQALAKYYTQKNWIVQTDDFENKVEIETKMKEQAFDKEA
jgi:phage/plasmid-associated DNA primase